jgi:cell division protein FtsN
MAADYKNSRAAVNKSTPGWIWLLVGFALGLVVALLVYLNGQSALQGLQKSTFLIPNEANPQPTQDQPTQDGQKEASSSAPKRRFDFYTLLPELDVTVPETPKPVQEVKVSPKVTKQAKSRGYVLQVGSFRKYQDADSLKARIALMGIESSIQTVHVNNSTWHRVRVGPYTDREQLNRIRDSLRNNNVKAILMMAKE